MAKRAKRDSGFIGIDAVIFGARDMAQARKLFADFGLAKKQDTKSRLVFATEIGSEIVIRPSGAKDLPPPIHPQSEFREVIWGVKSAKDVARLAEDLARDRAVRRDRDGTIHAIDDSGIHFGVRVWRHRSEPKHAAALPLNAPGARHRVDAPSPMYERAKPYRIGHIVFNVPDVPKAERFYTQRLGFSLSDRYAGGAATFLRWAARAAGCISPALAGRPRSDPAGIRSLRPISGISPTRSAACWNISPILISSPRPGSRRISASIVSRNGISPMAFRCRARPSCARR